MDIPVKTCDEITIFDPGIELNHFNKNAPLAFTIAYNRFYSEMDSLTESKYRRHTEKLVKEVVRKTLPEIILLEHQKSKTWNYDEVIQFLPRIQFDGEIESKIYFKKYFKNLEADSKFKKQLIILLTSYAYPQHDIITKINLYIIDTSLNKLVFYHGISYDCDSRDDKSLVKALSFILKDFTKNSG